MLIVTDHQCKSHRKFRVVEDPHSRPLTHMNGRPIRFKSPLSAARYMHANFLHDGMSIAELLKNSGYSAN